jgi:hypothetical protein
MSIFERKILAIAILLTVAWGGGLFVVYMLADSTTPPRSALESPDAVAANVPVVPAPLPVRGALVFPAAANVAPVAIDLEARRKQLMGVRAQVGSQNGVQYDWHSRFQNRTGVVLAPTTSATTTSATTMSTAAAPNTSTLITVHLTKASLRQALVAVANAAKMKVSITPPGWLDSTAGQPQIDLNADAQPLLEVVNELCCQSAALMYLPGQGSWWGDSAAVDPATPVLHLEHQRDDSSLGPWVISGRFSFEAQEIHHATAVDAGADPTMAQVMLKVTHEPALVVLAQSPPATVLEAEDDHGHSLLTAASAAPAQQRGLSFGQILALAVGAGRAPPTGPVENWTGDISSISVPLKCPVDFGHTLAKLSGSERFLIQQKAARLEIPIASPPANQDKTVDGVSVSVDQWQVILPQQVIFRLVIHRTDQDQTTWDRLCASIRQLNPVLLDHSGNALPASRVMNSNSEDNQCWCQFICQQNGYFEEGSRGQAPAKLMMDVPTAFAVMDVPFKFENLPLP